MNFCRRQKIGGAGAGAGAGARDKSRAYGGAWVAAVRGMRGLAIYRAPPPARRKFAPCIHCA